MDQEDFKSPSNDDEKKAPKTPDPPVVDDDTAETLAARILKEEHRIYSDAIELVLSGRCEIQGKRVIC